METCDEYSVYEREGDDSQVVIDTYTIDEVKEILGISKSTAYGIVRAKLFPGYCKDGVYEIPQKEFEEWFRLLTEEENVNG